MGWLVYPLGTSGMEPLNFTAIQSAAPRYHREHPKDLYGDALMVPCEFYADGQTGPAARLPADEEPQ